MPAGAAAKVAKMFDVGANRQDKCAERPAPIGGNAPTKNNKNKIQIAEKELFMRNHIIIYYFFHVN
jgi:hypothetical protein